MQIISFLILWSICLSSLVHFKKDPEYHFLLHPSLHQFNLLYIFLFLLFITVVVVVTPFSEEPTKCRKIRALGKKGNLQVLGKIESGHHQTSGDERKNWKNILEKWEIYLKPNYIVEISSKGWTPGDIFEKKMTFIPHLKYLKIKCNKTLKLLCVVAHKEWGADQNTLLLLLLYRSLIRSKLDDGSIIYWSAWKSYLKTFNPVYHGGLRLVFGAFRTSPAESLYTEANEAPANIRRYKLALQYYVKLNSCPIIPAHYKVFHPKYKELFQTNEKAIKPYDPSTNFPRGTRKS